MKDRFSYFLPPIWRDSSPQTLSLEAVWEYVSGRQTLQVERVNKEGETYRIGTLQEVTDKVRSLPPEVYQDKLKGKVTYLPLVTFGGTFTKREKESLLESSGLIGLDIDHISRLETGDTLQGLKDRLSTDREIGVRLVFTSPSGDGLKIVCKTSGEITDPDSYRKEFEILQSFVSRKYSVPIGEVGLDKGISDVSRGCLLCYDPDAVLQTWEDTFNPALHPLPPEERPRPKREWRTESVSSWDWDSFEEDRLVPALFDRIPELFPDMGFKWRGREWQSPYKLDGSKGKTPRGDKSYISQTLPGVISEHGGDSVPVIKYFAERNNLSRTEARKELSRLCGLEEEEKDLRRRYAQMKEQETYMESNTTGGQKPLHADQKPPLQTSTKETPEDREERYRRDYLPIKDLRETLSRQKEGIQTGYFFKGNRGEEALVLSPGLTLVCGKSSHGKTRLLENLTLQVLRGIPLGEEGVVLFFAYEEDLPEIILHFANLYTDVPQLSKYGTKNTEVLRDYFRTGELNKATQNKRTEALSRLKTFEEDYLEGRLRIIYDPDLQSGDLCTLVRYMSSQMKVKAVFIDYVQALYKENYRRERREELREICRELNKTSKDLGIPFVLSAQLNREAPSPTAMSGENIAESADITRYGNTILLLWNSSFARDLKDKEKYLQSQDYRLLQDKGFNFEEDGKLYCILTKNRGATPNIDAVLDFVGETGSIPSNRGDFPPDTPEEIQGEIEGFTQL